MTHTLLFDDYQFRWGSRRAKKINIDFDEIDRYIPMFEKRPFKTYNGLENEYLDGVVGLPLDENDSEAPITTVSKRYCSAKTLN